MASFKTDKLRGRIVEMYGTASRFADAVGSTYASVSNYLNGNATLSQKTIVKWKNALEIEDSEINDYFFDYELNETEGA